MKRNPRKVKWTKAFRKLAGKELAQDSTFDLERKRNRPEKYDREVMHKTITAIQKIENIRQKRQDRFYDTRMQKAKKQQKLEDKKQLEQEIHLVKAPAAIAKSKEKMRIPVEQHQAEDMQE